MSSSFDMGSVDDLTAGTVGPPGQRIFYLQARQADHVVTLRLEKAQVAALCEYLSALLADLPAPEGLHLAGELVEPVVAEWVVGDMGVTYDESADRVVVLAEELVAGDGEDPVAIAAAADARFVATRDQVAAFVRRGQELVVAGRPLCQLCGGPIDPEGHACIRANGHRKLRD